MDDLVKYQKILLNPIEHLRKENVSVRDFAGEGSFELIKNGQVHVHCLCCCVTCLDGLIVNVCP